MLYEYFFDDGITIMSLIVGLILGCPLALFEILLPWKKISRWPFIISIFLKAVLYVLLITLVILTTSYLYILVLDLPFSNFTQEIRTRAFVGITSCFCLYLVIIFFLHVNRLLGPGVLLRYLTGGYYRPKREERIFMFLDLKDSTVLAERLDYETYYALINDFFHDLSEPILATRAQIYQYVGDEVVLTWKTERGIQDANCIRIFFLIDKAIQRRKEYYLEEYKVVPSYKAGLHCGEVITAEIGDLKKDLIYNGDVLNTTARIESVCNSFQAKLLASADLIDRVELPADIKAEDLGPVNLKGKQEPLVLYRLNREDRRYL